MKDKNNAARDTWANILIFWHGKSLVFSLTQNMGLGPSLRICQAV